MGSVSSSYDVNGGTGKETDAGTARARSRGDVAGTDARVDKLARLMTSHQKKRRHPGTAFHMEREDEEFDSDQVNLPVPNGMQGPQTEIEHVFVCYLKIHRHF